MKLSDLLESAIQFNATEIHLIDTKTPSLLIDGKLQTLKVENSTQKQIISWLEEICPKEKMDDFDSMQQVVMNDFDSMKQFAFVYNYKNKKECHVKAFVEQTVLNLIIDLDYSADEESSPFHINDLLDCFVEHGASDLHLAVGVPPKLRINGDLEGLELPILDAESVKTLIYQILPEIKKQVLSEVGGADFGFSYKDGNRFRVSVLKQRGNLGAVLRIIPDTILTFEQTGLNPKIKELLYSPRGLFLVTGPTGSGKSTTMASMVDFINKNRPAHILTIEDPIEFYHDHQKCIVNQREVGVDVSSFSEALKGALRQDPDVILVGEMRDFETIELAVTAAETGHLVFGTLHTTGAAETIDRIIDVFPAEQQSQVRAQLANGLLAIVSQQLLKRKDKKGRIAAFEVLVATDSIRALVRDGKIHQIASFLQTGAKDGMNTLDDHLIKLYEQGIISSADLIDKANNRKTMRAYLGKSD